MAVRVSIRLLDHFFGLWRVALVLILAVGAVSCGAWYSLTGQDDAVAAIRARDQHRLEWILSRVDMSDYAGVAGRNLLHYAAVHGRETMLGALLEHGISPNDTDQSGRLPLHYAIESDSDAVAKSLVAVTAQLDRADEQGLTPLMMAARKGKPELVEKLLSAGADPDRRNAEGATALSLAAAADHPQVVKILREVSKRPPATAAAADVARVGDVKTLRWMIEQGLDIWSTWKEGGEEINLAEVAVDSSPRAAALLMRYGAGLEVNGDAALVAFALRGESGRVKELLAAGADPNAGVPGADTAGRTVLMEVARLGLAETAKALIEAGADPQQSDEYGADSLWHAAVGHISSADRHAGLERGKERGAMVVDLLRMGATPSGGDVYDFTPLHAAAAWGNEESVAALLEAGSYIEVTDRNGRTPLIFAAQFGNRETLQALLEHGADPSATAHIGSSVVTYARLAERLGDAPEADFTALVRDAGGRLSYAPKQGTPPLSVKADERRIMQLDQSVAIYDSAEVGGAEGGGSHYTGESRGKLPYTTTCSGFACIYPPVVVIPAGTAVEMLYREADSGGRPYRVYMVHATGLRGLLFEDDLFGTWPPAGAASSELTIGRVAHIRGMRWVEAFDVDLSAATGGLIW